MKTNLTTQEIRMIKEYKESKGFTAIVIIGFSIFRMLMIFSMTVIFTISMNALYDFFVK